MRAPFRLLMVILIGVSTTGCLSFMKKNAGTETAPPVVASATPAAAECNGPTDDELAQRDDRIRELRAADERRSLELLAQRAEIERIQRKIRTQTQLLDEAIHEVVRARAKQRSVESRAQAASEIAEAEIALTRMNPAWRGQAEVTLADQLLQEAGSQFDAENFGGALYLATQAKSRIRGAALRNEDRGMTELAADGEQTFGAPVPLEVSKRSNFRQGPGTEFPVLRKIEVGAVLTGYATKGSWVRVRSADGADGWIHQSLVRGG